MADRLSSRAFRQLRPIAAIAMVLASPLVGAQAGSLPDPTRPADIAAAPDGSSNAPPAPAGLQAVVLRPGGRSVAVINGESVPVGGKVGEARLVALTADAAVLVGPNGREVLKLAPAVAVTRPQDAGVRTHKMRRKASGRGDGHE